MSDGKILQEATYNQLLASNKEFQDLVNAHKETAGSERLTVVSSTLPVDEEHRLERLRTFMLRRNYKQTKLMD